MTNYPPFIQKLLDSRPLAHQGVHPWLFKMARRLHAFHSSEEICKILEEKTADCGRILEPHEIRDAVHNSKACQWVPPGVNGKNSQTRREEWLKSPTSKAGIVPPFDPKMAIETANRISFEVTPKWLEARSPRSINCSLEEYLKEVFRPGEKVRIFNHYKSQGGVWPDSKIDFLRFSQTAWPDGVWFLCNPIDGQQHFNPRQNKLSFRSQESVTDWRHAVLECDHEPKEVWRPIWLKILVQLPLPILSLVDSGNISIHALVRVPCQSKESWDHFKAEKLRPLVKIGACDGSLSAVRLTRAPNCWRGTNRQSLLYFNPEADGIPIIRRAGK
jgi:hypothetical protein